MIHDPVLVTPDKRPLLSAAQIAMLLVILFALLACLAGGGTGYAATDAPEIRVGSELEFPPYAFVDENGQPAGFSVDLINAVADVMGLSIKISSGPWDTVWNDLVAGRIDVLPLVAKTPERTRLVDFALPHTETFDAFFVRKGDSPIQGIKEAEGKEIVIMRSDVAHHELLERNFEGRLVLVDTIPEGLALIASGKYDALLCSKLIGTLAIKEHGLKGLAAGPPIPDYKRVFSFAVKKGDTDLLEKLNQGLMIIKTNGVYDRIYEKWLTAEDPWLTFKKYLFPAVVIAAAVALIIFFWIMILQQQVRKRTRELAEANALLSQSRDELEERVAQRTLELTQSNRALQTEITDRKRAEDHMKHLASFPQLNPNPVVETDLSGRITYFNQAIRNILEDLGLDGNDANVFLPDDFDDILQQLMEKPGSTLLREVRIKDRVFSSTVHFAHEFDVVRIYSNDITVRKQAESVILRTKEEWERTFDSVPDLIAILDQEHRIVRANRAMAEKLGTTSDQCVGLQCFACVHGTSGPPEICPHTFTMNDGKEHSAEVREDRLGGDFLVTTTPMFDETGKMTGSVHVARDITDRKEAESRIKASLHEKELLLREVHHRVKNNMMVITSLLKLQSRKISDRRYKNMFDESIHRIRSMALIHEKLYRAGDMSDIKFDEYLESLLNFIGMSYDINTRKISLKKDLGRVSLGISDAIPCGLIINELITNCLKYAFRGDDGGEIRISLREIEDLRLNNDDVNEKVSNHQSSADNSNSTVELVVEDNGIGLPVTMDLEKVDSLGLNMVHMLVKQIHGSIDIFRDRGTEFRIRFRK